MKEWSEKSFGNEIIENKVWGTKWKYGLSTITRRQKNNPFIQILNAHPIGHIYY